VAEAHGVSRKSVHAWLTRNDPSHVTYRR
jgi:hypothetical protein